MNKIQTAERVSQTDPSDNFVFQRSLLAYHKAARMVYGQVLEIGTGSGYGAALIAPHTGHFTTIDKFRTENAELRALPNVDFVEMSVPPLSGFASESFDFVVSFQVIEHIEHDCELIAEMARVLRPEGRLILSTPNRLMSLTRNPWHVREYTAPELADLLSGPFGHVDAMGVFGNEKVTEYYEQNRSSVRRITRFDIFDLQHRLPRRLLQIPYDVANRINRRKLLKENRALTSSITMDDYRIAPANEQCFDLFFVAQKKGDVIG